MGHGREYNTEIMLSHFFNELLDFNDDRLGSVKFLTIADLTILYDECLSTLGCPMSTHLREDIGRILQHPGSKNEPLLVSCFR